VDREVAASMVDKLQRAIRVITINAFDENGNLPPEGAKGTRTYDIAELTELAPEERALFVELVSEVAP
jgi:hypothetical protein